MTAAFPLPVAEWRWTEPVQTGLSGFGRFAFFFLWLFVFTMPGEKVLEIPGIGTITRLIGLVSVAIGVLAIAEAKRIRRPAPVHVAMGIFLAWAGASYAWSLRPDWTREKVYTYFQLFLMAWLIWELCRDEREQLSLMQAYVLGTFISAGDTIWNYLFSHQVYYLRYATTGFDPNDLGVTLALSLPMSYYLALRSKGAMVWIYRIQIAAAGATILLTASRGALLVSLAGMLIVPLTFGRLSARLRFGTLGVGILMAVAAALLAPASSLARFGTIQSEVTQGSFNKRTMIWSAGWEALREHPFRGVGVGAFPAGVEPILGVEPGMVFVAHNSFLSVLVESGTIGFLMFVGMLGALALSILDLGPLERRLWTVTLLAWSVGVFSLTWENRKPTWLIFGLIAAQWGSVRGISPGLRGARASQ